MKWKNILLLFFLPVLLAANDEVLFRVAAEPAAMLFLDRSGSMAGTRMQQALLVIKNLLDADGNGIVEDSDRDILGVDLATGFFYNTPSGTFNPDPYIYLPGEATGSLRADTFGTGYSTIWTNTNHTTTGGWTPNGPSIHFASEWIHHYDTTHPDLDCRSYYLIFITDGESNGYGTSATYSQIYESDDWRGSWCLVREAAISYRERGIPPFMVGFGTGITQKGRNELNWAAYWGGTDNPEKYNYSDMQYNPPHTHVHEPWTWPQPIPSGWGSTTGWYNPRSAHGTSYQALPPSFHYCDGYAYIAQTAEELSQSLQNIFQSILENNFSFSPASVPVVRTMISDTAIVYATFRPQSGGFWDGQLRAIVFTGDTVLGPQIWTAGESLQQTPSGVRKIFYTNQLGVKSPFTFLNVLPSELGVFSGWEKDLIVQRTREGYSAASPGWKLGDIFHSAPLMIGAPSPFYTGDPSYVNFRKNNAYRDNRKRVYVGTNIGVLHCFDASTGKEVWAWVPKFALSKMKIWALDNQHTYILDGPVTAADLWADVDMNGQKDADDWRTILIVGQREGGSNYLILDITYVPTNPDSSEYPKLLAEISGTLIGGLYKRFADTWSQPTAGQFRMDTDPVDPDSAVPVWGFFIGGGYAPDFAGGFLPDTGDFFAFWGLKDNTAWAKGWENPNNNGIAASLAMTDMNINGFVDYVIAPDLAGNLLVMDTETDTNPSNWTLRTAFMASTGAPADADMACFFPVAVAQDFSGQYWYCWGSGNRDNPMDTTKYGYFFMLLSPPSAGAPATMADMVLLTDVAASPGDNGFYYKHTHPGEKVTSLPLIYSNYVYWTTFAPDTAEAGPCDIGAGYARMYVASLLEGRMIDQIDLGHIGIPSSPQVTVGPDGPVVIVMTSSGPIVREIAGPGFKKKYVYWNEVY